ncbi:glycosyltransferase family 4 protein, partial [bacterium]|nr:glycosyltransferase family 4 protein [bacterium]
GSNIYKWFLPNYKIRAKAHRSGPYEKDLYFQPMLSLPGAIASKCINPLWQKYVLRRIGSKMNFDLIHVHFNLNLAYGALLTAKKRGVPLVLTLRREVNANLNNLGKTRAKLLIKAIEQADEIISPSQHLAKKCHEITGRQAIVISSGTDNCFDQMHSAFDDSRQNVLFVGTLDENKGIATLIKATLKLFNKGLKFDLRIIGEGPLRSKLASLNNGHPNITFLGRLLPKAVREEMRSAKLFCTPSYSETLGLVYIEAMKQGVPVIGRKGTGIDGTGKKGVHYETIENDNDLPDLISSLLADDKRRTNMAHNGQKLAAEFTWDNCARKHIQLYESLIKT